MAPVVSYQEFEETCREHGLRLTQQRFEIYRALKRKDQHLTAEQVHAAVRRKIPNVSVDTVYRALDTFASNGVIRKFLGPDGAFRYDSNPELHHHAICIVCGQIEDFEWPAFDRLGLPDEAEALGVVESRLAELRVVCKRCRRTTGSPR